ncbi:MAG: OmpA family protein [Bacteroidetes bacterium]|nr:OmpA family protein [Bacteroidota bacterium]
MIKEIRLLLCCLIGFSALNAQVRLAGEIGIQSANVIEKNSIPGWDSTTKNLYSSKSGLRLGILVEIPIAHNLYFQPGLNYNSKGRNYTKNYDSSGTALTDSVYAKSKLQLGYMEMPLYITYKLPLSANHKNSFFIGAGPYFSFILNASMNYQNLTRLNDTTVSYTKSSEDLLIGNAVNKYKTFDFGINAKAGFEFGNVMLTGFYSRGLSNFFTASYNGTFHHQVFGATLGIWIARTSPAVAVPVVKKDTDKDGIPDEQDMCPLQPGTAKYSGCPVPDADHDGIDDEHDSCKTIAGVEKYNGCPVPDTDGDGIDDEHDSCKTVAGVAKYHGCPIPDRDNDGVNDEEDKCPDTPGTKENNGCPVIKQEIKEQVNYVAHNILFKTASDKLTPDSYIAIDELVALLNKHPELHLTIDGFTDNTGTVTFNQTLSQKRADAVKNVLIQKGIDEKRLTSAGHGQEQPIADNSTEAGRAANRRVELKLSQEKL